MGSLFFLSLLKVRPRPKRGEVSGPCFLSWSIIMISRQRVLGRFGGGGLLGFPDRRVFYANNTNRTRSCPYGGLAGRALLHTRHTIAPSGRNE